MQTPSSLRLNTITLPRATKLSVGPDQLIVGGDRVVALGDFHATTEAGDRIESPFAHVYDLHDGRINRFMNYTDIAL